MPLIYALLTLSNVVFIAAVLYQIRVVAQAPPSASFPDSLLIAFRAFVTLA